MKILHTGVRPKPYHWMGVWQCGSCGTVIETEEGDRPQPTFHDDQREGSWITTECPICKVKRSFYPVKDAASRWNYQ